MNNISLKTKLYTLAGILILFMTISTTVSLIKMDSIGNEIVGINDNSLPLTKVITKIATLQLEQTISFERMLRYGEERQNDANQLTHFNAEIVHFKTQSTLVNDAIKEGEKITLNALNNTHFDESATEYKNVVKLLGNITEQHQNYEQHIFTVIDELKKGNTPRALALANKIETEEDKINNNLAALLLEIEQFTEKAVLRTEHDEQSAFVLLIVIAGISAVIGWGMAVFIIHNLIKNIRSAIEVAKVISSGDLTKEVKSTGSDEMGQLLTALGTMRDTLHRMITQMNDSSAQLASSSEEFAAVSEETNQNINNQQSEIEQSATAINEMTATIQEVAKNAASTSKAAQSTNEATADGQAIFEKTVSSVSQLANNIQDTSEVIHLLETHSEDIGSVLSVIKGIAEQTNLLALNAAIEAARAGEQGRGFAVVADEVRTLASRTQESTSEIEDMIEKLQSGSMQAVKAMESSRNQAAESVDFASSVGAKLQKITDSVSLITDMSTQIATAAEEQACVSDEINRNITSISDLGSQTAAGAHETMASSEELAQIATDLHDLIANFKV